MAKERGIALFLFLIIVVLGGPGRFAHAETEIAGLDLELKNYINDVNGRITVSYKSLENNKGFKWNDRTSVAAASTIKLPLALYVMKLADQGAIDLNEVMTYEKHQYYPGSGVIQFDAVGSKYTIEELVEKAMVHSDNIAFIMLKQRVGAKGFIGFMKDLGGEYAYPEGRNVTSAHDLSLYAAELFRFSQNSKQGDKLVGFLKNSVYNTTIPQGIPNVEVAHKVGMIPEKLIYNDIALVFDDVPYTLAVTTNGLPYEKSQQVIAEIAAIVHKYHKAQTKPIYAVSKLTGERLEKIQDEQHHYAQGKGPGTVFIWSRNPQVLSSTNSKREIISDTTLTSSIYEGLKEKMKNVFEWGKRVGEGFTWKGFADSVSGAEKPEERKDSSSKKYKPVPDAKVYEQGSRYTDSLPYLNKKRGGAEPIRLTFAGDAMMDWSVKETVRSRGADFPFVHVKEELSASDLAVVNLESAVTDTTGKYTKEL